MSNPRLEQLKQLMTITWDGNLISKTDREELFKSELCAKSCGWNFLTPEGVRVLIMLGELKP